MATNVKCTQQIARPLAVVAFVLALSAAANADNVLDLAAGTLQLGTTNNEFLLEFGLNGAGLETPYPAFLNNGSSLLVGNGNTSYLQSTNPSFTFDFSFSVGSQAVLSDNATFSTFVGSTTSSVTLLQGSNVVDTAVQTSPSFVGSNYLLPSVTLQPDTQYDLVVTTLGVPASYDSGFSGTQGWGQIPVDISPTSALTLTGGTPETAPFLSGDGYVSQISGMVGGSNTQDFYAFYWAGGDFDYSITGDPTLSSSQASIYGLEADPQCAPYATSECYFINGQGYYLPQQDYVSSFSCGEEDGAPGCQTSGGLFLAPGYYEAGVSDTGTDPDFILTFNTPLETGVSSSPEPSALSLLVVGLALMGRRRRKTAANIFQKRAAARSVMV